MSYSENASAGAERPAITRDFINIRKVFRDKNERLAKWIPGFIYRYLERVVHQDMVNDFLYRNKDKVGLDFVEAILKDFGYAPVVTGAERIPAEGRYLAASNHPLGGMDGIALMHFIGQVREDLVFPVNDILMNIPNLAPLFIPINKHGSNAENIRVLNDTFASGKLILYFPAGLVSRKQNGRIRDLEWKKTFLTKARQYKRDILPIYTGGRNSDFFYNLANWRKRLGIGANIEMLYLVDEMARQKAKNFDIIFGKAIPCTTFDKRFNDRVWAQKLKEHVYALKEDPDRVFDYIIR